MRLFTHNNLTGNSESEGGAGRVIVKGERMSAGVRIRGDENEMEDSG